VLSGQRSASGVRGRAAGAHAHAFTLSDSVSQSCSEEPQCSEVRCGVYVYAQRLSTDSRGHDSLPVLYPARDSRDTTKSPVSDERPRPPRALGTSTYHEARSFSIHFKVVPGHIMVRVTTCGTNLRHTAHTPGTGIRNRGQGQGDRARHGPRASATPGRVRTTFNPQSRKQDRSLIANTYQGKGGAGTRRSDSR
jgi:hypothetical protein